jgi:class 3 adenylate cyclase
MAAFEGRGTSSAQELRPATILFADIQGYTTLSEQLDVELVTEVLVPCLNRLAAIVRHYGGRVGHSAGDNIMAVFGYPTAHEDDPVRAVRCALGMLQAIDEMAPFCQEKLGQRLNIRVGVNTGTVLAGAVGLGTSENVRGDAVNVAARLETAAQPGTVLVGSSTRQQASWAFRWGEPRLLQVKGRDEPVEACEAIEALSDRARPRGISALPTPFMGRERELAELRRLWGVCVERGCQVVSIVGDAGVGKSRLVAEFELSLHAEEVLFVRGTTPPVGNQPYGPVIAALQVLTGAREEERAGLPGDLLHLLSETDAPSPQDKEMLFRQVAMLLEAEAKRRPFIIVLEDLHWADGATIELVNEILSRLRAAPVMLLLLYRPWRDSTSWKQGCAA